MSSNITQQRVHELFSLDKERWALVWKGRSGTDFATSNAFSMWNKRFAFRDAGFLNQDGYVVICVDNIRYKSHHLIWLYIYGYKPSFIDHIDGNRANNDIANLREANCKINATNRGVGRNSPLGISGVTKNVSGSYMVKININGRQEYLGSYRDLDEAIARRRLAEVENGYHANHGTAGRVGPN